jgi:predicted GIY-YIG superfamily endonuclease
MPFYVYCLATVQEPIQTYIGATVDLDRRLAQHNREQSGGARATGVREGDWYRVCAVEGFDTWKGALSFEWHWKWYSKKQKGDPLTRRQKGLDECIKWWGERCKLSILDS